ncbi:MAG: hypothetical protein PHD67_08620 [Oscillospiraceae bacterium]|nr:hypothetical protein [Oscillospiraceae bacterium]
MTAEENDRCIFKRVEPLKGHQLRIYTAQDEEILFDFTPCLCKTRFADLKNDALFYSAATDGRNIIFKIHGSMPLILCAGEFYELRKNTITARGEERGASWNA